MAVRPKKINAATFQVSFTDGVQIGATNMYLGLIENKIPAMYFLHDKEPDNDLNYWYNFGLRYNNPYILQVYGKSDYFLRGRKEMELLFTEVIDYNLEDWAKKNPLLHSPNSTRLSAPFIGILLDILHGLIYFHINLQRPHGDIASHNIYIAGGKAKLANMVNTEKYNLNSFEHDIVSFKHMIDDLFQTSEEEIPLELSQLFESLLISVETVYGTRNNVNFLLNSVHHPILLTPKRRGELRHSAYLMINSLLSPDKRRIRRLLEREFNYAMIKFPSIQGFNWINNVNKPEFLSVLHFQQPSIQGLPQVTYKDTLIDFLRYSRNVGEHAQDTSKRRLDDDIKDEMLTLYLPGFLPILHDVLTHKDIFVSPLPISK